MKHFKYYKRFILTVIVLSAIAFIALRTPETHFSGHDSEALTQHYNTITADNINSKTISVYLDDELKVTSETTDIWMSNKLSLMMPIAMVNDFFQCDVSMLKDGIVQIGRDNTVLLLDTEKQLLNRNGSWESQEVSAYDKQEKLCLSASLLADELGYDYKWEDTSNSGRFTMPEKQTVTLPETFDLRDEGRVSDVRDQGSWGTCWAFASLAALESSLLPEQNWQFSVDHLTMNNGFNTTINEGGDYNMTLAYMTSWKGPVTEDEDPYGDGVSSDALKAAVHLQEAVIINEKDYDQLKRLIYTYGGVQSAIYSQPDIRDVDAYYDEENAAYYYPGEETCNHDIVIIGWDDHYPKENFSTMPDGDGAFLCKNSWGSGFGQDGYFYISYYDHNIAIYGIAYTRVETADNYDRLYQSDLLGWTGSIGYDDPSAWFSSVYTAETDSNLAAVGFYATDASTYYDIYYVGAFDSVEDMDRRVWLQSGYFADKGYYTVDLKNQPAVIAGERYAIVIDIYTEGSAHPIAMEYVSGELTQNVDLSDGESYMSYNGNLWTHMENSSNCNACLKVYADDTEQ